MPVYEYKCSKCGRFDVEQNIKAEALTRCPTCQSPVQRLIGRNVGVIFKGSGFYCTDNRKTAACTSQEECAKEATPTAACGSCAKAGA
ncbi:MAG: FmdB family zinc ribbon protein [Bacillota bacterium]